MNKVTIVEAWNNSTWVAIWADMILYWHWHKNDHPNWIETTVTNDELKFISNSSSSLEDIQAFISSKIDELTQKPTETYVKKILNKASQILPKISIPRPQPVGQR